MFLKRYFKGITLLVLSSLNKLDATTKGTKLFSNPQALSSALAVLRTLQPRAFGLLKGLLNRLVSLVLVSNYYVAKVHTYVAARVILFYKCDTVIYIIYLTCITPPCHCFLYNINYS